MIDLNTNVPYKETTYLPKRVLVIDDEESICLLLKEYFEILGLEVTTELSGVEGVNALNSENYGLVICDVSMPGMDGFQVFEQVLNNKPDQNFLFMTGYSFGGSQQLLVDKSLGLLRKPFQLTDLNLIISELFSDV